MTEAEKIEVRSKGRIVRFSRPFLKKSESKAAGNTGLAAMSKIPKIGPDNPGGILSG